MAQVVTREQHEHLVSVLRTIVEAVIAHFEKRDGNWKGKLGGFFCVADGATGTLFHPPAQIGGVMASKADKYMAFCQEKANRLALHPEHEASWESRDPETSRWGGAVRVEGVIFSFSGLPEAGDEALMLALAEIHFSRRVEDTARRIATRNENRYWEAIRKIAEGLEPMEVL